MPCKTIPLAAALLLLFQLSTQAKIDSVSYNETSIRNLTAFTRMYGGLRYFYPSEKLEKMDWERFLEEGVSKIAPAKNNAELVAALNSYCGSKDVYASLSTTSERRMAGTSGKIKYWRHLGFGAGSKDMIKGFMGFLYRIFGPYRSHIVSKKDGKNVPQPDSLYSYQIADGITLHMRHALYKKKKLPPEYKALAKTFKEKKKDEEAKSKENQNFRLAAAIYSCAVLENFYPYPEFVSHDWNEIIPGMLKKAASDTSNRQFVNSLNALLSELNDGHAGAYLKGDSNVYIPPVSFVLIDSNIVVKACDKCDSIGVQVGDILTEVDGKNARKALKEEEKLWSSPSPVYKSYLAFYSFASGLKNSAVEMKFRTEENTEKTVALKRTHTYVYPAKRFPADTVFNSNVVYLNLAQANSKLIYKTLSDLKPDQSIIFDNRGYPNQGPHFLQKMAPVKVMESQKWTVPIYTFPFQHHMEYDTSNWEIGQAKSKKRIPESCKVVFLTNYRAISASETLMSIVKYYKVGTVIGETTAATNGNIVGGGFGAFSFVFTGMKVLNQDGSQFHGIGVKPDIEVKQTLEGIRAGRDEVLEYALEYLKSN